MPRDALYAEPLTQVSDFVFDAKVVEVFPDMINRSVPGYRSIVHGIGQLAKQFVQPHSRIYDLGCSLGAASLSIRQQLPAVAGVELIAVDNSAAMVERCRLQIASFRGDLPVHVELADIRDYPLSDASVVVMNFTLQFIPPEQREALLARIYAALKPGGALILAEKFQAEAPFEQILIELHHEFKRANGYSDLEIAQKRAAIEHVMRIDTLASHQQRLQRVGFAASQVWFQCFNFAALLAVKAAEAK